MVFNMRRLKRHLVENNITYIAHLKSSMGYSIESGKASVIFAIHAFVPCVFEQTGSEKLNLLIWKIRKKME